jgi:hypothetical protein
MSSWIFWAGRPATPVPLVARRSALTGGGFGRGFGWEELDTMTGSDTAPLDDQIVLFGAMASGSTC